MKKSTAQQKDTAAQLEPDELTVGEARALVRRFIEEWDWGVSGALADLLVILHTLADVRDLNQRELIYYEAVNAAAPFLPGFDELIEATRAGRAATIRQGQTAEE